MKYCESCHAIYPNEFSVCPKDQSGLRMTSEFTPGMIIRDKYEILEKIGAGGMAAVYRARHLAFNEIRAIKIVSSRLIEDQTFVKRFKAEAIITRKLSHPNAVSVEDLDTLEDGRPYIVMEYVKGKNLRNVIQESGAMPVPRALNVARQIASALAAAHQLGIVHRDIKPDNALVIPQSDGSDLIKVLDFGIAKMRQGTEGAHYTATQTGMVVGTPQYISPEQAMGKPGDEVDGRADLYSLGVVLYEMLTGQLPFQSETPIGLLMHHIHTVPTPPHYLKPELNIPAPISLLLMKALEKDRTKRFQSADEMLAALTRPQIWATTAIIGSDILAAMSAAPAPGAPPKTVAMASAAPAVAPAPAPQARRVPVPQPPAAPAVRRPAAVAQEETSFWGRPAVLAGAVLLVVIAAIVYARSRPSVPSDAKIFSEVRRVLNASEPLRQDFINVDVKSGVVTLSGTALHQSDAQLATSLAGSVTGVSGVNNSIQVQESNAPVNNQASVPSTPSNDSSSSSSTAPTDARILSEVQRVLRNSDVLRQDSVDANVDNGVVTLIGTAANREHSDIAKSLAASVNGVRDVRNNISVNQASRLQPADQGTDTGGDESVADSGQQQPQPGGGGQVRQHVQAGYQELRQRHPRIAMQEFQAALDLNPNNQHAQEGMRKAQMMLQNMQGRLRRD